MAQAEVSDELELIPTFAIALSGCDLRCDFCITGGPSWNPRAGEPLSVAAVPRRREGGGDALVAARGGGAAFTGLRGGVAATFQPQRFSGLERLIRQAEQALADGARTIMILGGEPTIHLPAALEIVAALPDDAKLVWKTNAHGSAQARALLDGMFDVWLADFKFGNDACAQRLAKVPDYVRVVRENLLWANEHSELIVRHLLMPGHVECCWRPVAEWLAGNLLGVKVNLRSGFWPAWHSARHSDLRRTVSNSESAQAGRIARNCGLNLVE
jgi:putative pyruvate formate lyase activating enzyme